MNKHIETTFTEPREGIRGHYIPNKYEDDPDQHDRNTCDTWVVHIGVEPQDVDAALDGLDLCIGYANDLDTTGEYLVGDKWEVWGEPAVGDDKVHLAVYFKARTYSDPLENQASALLTGKRIAGYIASSIRRDERGKKDRKDATVEQIQMHRREMQARADKVTDTIAVSTPGDFAEQIYDMVRTSHQFTVLEQAHHHRARAEHFEQRDWDWTRKTKISRIRYKDDFKGYDHPLKRLKRWADDYALWRKPKSWVERSGREIALKHPLIHARVSLGTERHLPDGHLDGGGVVAIWEEIGEYIQGVQPSVGSKIADLMEAHPSNPEVIALAVEMKRVADRYSARIKNGEVSARNADGEWV